MKSNIKSCFVRFDDLVITLEWYMYIKVFLNLKQKKMFKKNIINNYTVNNINNKCNYYIHILKILFR